MRNALKINREEMLEYCVPEYSERSYKDNRR